MIGSLLKPETLARMSKDQEKHSLERFQECIDKVWNGPIPECFACAVIGFGKRARLF